MRESKSWFLGYRRYLFLMTVAREMRRGVEAANLLSQIEMPFRGFLFAREWGQTVQIPMKAVK